MDINTIMSLLTVSTAQKKLAEYARAKRLEMGLTQEGLAIRSGVRLPTLRKFEQKGVISLESYLKLQMVVGHLEKLVEAVKPQQNQFSSIDEVLTERKTPKKGWRK